MLGRRLAGGAVLGLLLCLAAAQASASAPSADRPLRAAVWEHRDRTTRSLGAAVLLQAAGVEVIDLPTERSPLDLEVDLIVLGSMTAEAPGYRPYLERSGEELTAFVARGGVLLQLAQPDELEPSPPFLPEGLSARRGDIDYGHLGAAEEPSVLLEGLLVPWFKGPAFPLSGHPLKAASWDTFEEQEGFRVLLWCDTQIPYRYPALLEGSHGDGRFLLTSLFLDKLYGRDGRSEASEAYQAAAETFFRNVARYLRELRAGRLPPAAPTVPDPPPLLPREAGSWTLALLPDSQMYSESHPGIFEAQTRWIVREREARDIVYVLHAGDIVNQDRTDQWRAARRAMRVLEGEVPYAIVPGNHDYPGHRILARRTRMSKYFPVERAEAAPGFGGVFEEGRLENSYHLFSAGGRGWIVLALEVYPRDEVVAWAGALLERHAERSAILLTHIYLGQDDRRIDRRGRFAPPLHPDHPFPEGVNDGEDLWRKLVAPHANVVFVFCGHVTGAGTGRLTSLGEHGQPVHQVLANYQMRPSGGEGYLRLLEFLPDGETVHMRTYSPWLDAYLTWPEHQYRLELPPAPEPAGD
jgi:hypothetical protein